MTGNAEVEDARSRHDADVSTVGKLAEALDLIPLLHAELGELRSRLVITLADLHNLVAAAQATLAGQAEGEDDSLYYLRYELEAMGQLPPASRQQP